LSKIEDKKERIKKFDALTSEWEKLAVVLNRRVPTLEQVKAEATQEKPEEDEGLLPKNKLTKVKQI